MSCLDDNQVAALVAGRLAPDQRYVVESHIDMCEPCRELIAVVAGPTTLGGTSYFLSGARRQNPAAPALSVGDEIDGFRIEGFLGGGGMGDVYRARDKGLGRSVALKLINPGLASTPQAIELFLTEARATAKVRHQSIVTVHALGRHDGQPYMVLELLDGATLHERMLEKQLGLEQALSIGAAVAGALAEAHRHGVLHRDLKPANIHLGADGVPRVLDFGLARLVQDEPRGEAGASHEAPLAGTPRYMAPEQWSGQPSSRATDTWALGLVLFEMCAGQHPFDAASIRVQRAMVCGAEPVPSLPQHIPPTVRTLIRRCLSRHAAERPTASELAATLQACTAHVPAPPVRRIGWWPIAAVGLMAGIGGVAWLVIAAPWTAAPWSTAESTVDQSSDSRKKTKKKRKGNKTTKSKPKPTMTPIAPLSADVPCDSDRPIKKQGDRIISCTLAAATKVGPITCSGAAQIRLHHDKRLESCRLGETVTLGEVPCAAGYGVRLFPSGTLMSCQLRMSKKIGGTACDVANVQMFDDGRLKRCRTSKSMTRSGIDIPSGSYLRLYASGKPERVERPKSNTLRFKSYDCVTVSYFESGEIKTCEVNERPTLGNEVLPFINRTYCFDKSGAPTQAHGLECFLNK